MAVNKLALIRYKTIDKCLQNRFRKWTLEDLIEAVSDALYEYEGIASGVGKRTIQLDIQNMRSDKLGYFAPIIIKDKKFYTYEDKEYSITKTPINSAEIEKMKEIVSLLKHLNGFNYFDEMSDMIAKLENNLQKNTTNSKNYIQFEANKQLKGLQHIYPLFQAIRNQTALLLEYKSFKANESRQQIYYPYLLKEYRNRWFLIARTQKSKVLVTLALDRIITFYELLKEPYVENEGVDFDVYYNDVLGVTKTEKDRPHKVILRFDKANSPYVLTKPIHPSQQVLEENENGLTIQIEVVLNFELEREILGFGENIQVLSPRFLQKRIKERIEKATKKYQTAEKES